MKGKSIRLGGGGAGWGDIIDPTVILAEQGNIDYLGMDSLAELTLSILQRMKMRNPAMGYATDISRNMKALLPVQKKNGVRILSNSGGINPEGGAEKVIEIAGSLDMQGLKVGVVTGDDLTDRIDDLIERGISFKNLDTGNEDIKSIRDDIINVNAYIGTFKVADALKDGANVVLTGRVSDLSLFLGPMIHEFGWKEDDWDLLAAGSVIAHIIECSGHCTGGNFSGWRYVPEPWNLGYPIAEVYEDGEAIITKTEGTGGLVTVDTVREHLVYEVHDPRNYFTPDVTADLSSIKLEQVGKNKVKISGVKGKPKSDTLKVCVGYKDGFMGEGFMTYSWPDAYEKAQRGAEIVKKRLEMLGCNYEEYREDYIGVNSLHGPLAPEPGKDLNEVRLRVAARCKTKKDASMIGPTVNILWSLGPCAYGGIRGNPPVTEIFRLWPTLVPRTEIIEKYTIKEA